MHLTRVLPCSPERAAGRAQWEDQTDFACLQGARHPVGAREVNMQYKAGFRATVGEAQEPPNT